MNKSILLVVVPLIAIAAILYWVSRNHVPTFTAGNTVGFYGTPTSTTNSNSSGASAILVGDSGRTIYLTDITASETSVPGEITVKNGSTVIWQDLVGSTTYSHSFQTPIRSSAGNNITATVTGSSTVNLSGYFTP